MDIVKEERSNDALAAASGAGVTATSGSINGAQLAPFASHIDSAAANNKNAMTLATNAKLFSFGNDIAGHLQFGNQALQQATTGGSFPWRSSLAFATSNLPAERGTIFGSLPSPNLQLPASWNLSSRVVAPQPSFTRPVMPPLSKPSNSSMQTSTSAAKPSAQVDMILNSPDLLEALAKKLKPVLNANAPVSKPAPEDDHRRARAIAAEIADPISILQYFCSATRIPDSEYKVTPKRVGVSSTLTFGYVKRTFGNPTATYPKRGDAKCAAAREALAWLIDLGLFLPQPTVRKPPQASPLPAKTPKAALNKPRDVGLRKSSRLRDLADEVPAASRNAVQPISGRLANNSSAVLGAANPNKMTLKRRRIEERTVTPEPERTGPVLTAAALRYEMSRWETHYLRVLAFCRYLSIKQPEYVILETTASGSRWAARFPDTEIFLYRAGDIAITQPISDHADGGKEACAKQLETVLMQMVENGEIKVDDTTSEFLMEEDKDMPGRILDDIDRHLQRSQKDFNVHGDMDMSFHQAFRSEDYTPDPQFCGIDQVGNDNPFASSRIVSPLPFSQKSPLGERTIIKTEDDVVEDGKSTMKPEEGEVEDSIT